MNSSVNNPTNKMVDYLKRSRASLTGEVNINEPISRFAPMNKKQTEPVSVETAPVESPDDVPEKIGIDVLDSFLQRIERVSFAESENDKVKHNGYYIGSIDNLLKTAREHGFDIGIKNQNPHVFTGTFWQRTEQEQFRHFLQSVGVRQGIPHNVIKDHKFVDKLEDQFVSEARFPILSTNNTPKINLRNGTLHFTPDGVELKQFDKQDGLTYQLHYDYDESATAPLFKQFIDHVLPDAAVQKLVFQYIGYVFLRHMKLEKILFLYGGGANGKSVFLSIVGGLVGAEQCCEFSLEGITESESQRAELGHYLLNVSTEISTRLKTEIFKKIASREPLQARYLYKQPFTLREYATSIFSLNNLPKDVEQTDAYYRRFLIVPFNICIPESEQDIDLPQKIVTGEMSGVLNYVIDGIKSLIAEGHFDIPDVVRVAVENFRQESDSVLSFLAEDEYQISTENWKSLNDMYNIYKERCKNDGRQALQKANFSKRLRSIGYTVVKRGHNKQTMVNTDNAKDRDALRKPVSRLEDVPC